MYSFSNNWFQTSELCKNIRILPSPDTPHRILEIGSYEGASACFFSDNLLNHPNSHLVCVDPFDVSDTTTLLTNSTKDTCMNNLKKSRNASKITFNCEYSSDFYAHNKQTFSFIYIDGSHLPDDIRTDFENCLNVLDVGGIMWMDDYLGADGIKIKVVIDQLYERNKHRLEIVWKGYQIAFRKRI